jgi:hypothetical protein
LNRESGALWRATIAGLGATGLIVSAVLILVRWIGRHVKFSQKRFVGMGEFLEKAANGGEFTVGWIDALSEPVRGILFSGAICESGNDSRQPRLIRTLKTFRQPLIPAINAPATKAFNWAYWMAHPERAASVSSWEKFFCPLDELNGWNRLYGKAGFSQFQCVVPFDSAERACNDIFSACRKAGLGSFLAVIKTFGPLPSEGVLSFPREGVTFAMDFPNGPSTPTLLSTLCSIAMNAGGALYPAKVCFKSMGDFALSYPNWEEWRACWDTGSLGAKTMWIKRLQDTGEM